MKKTNYFAYKISFLLKEIKIIMLCHPERSRRTPSVTYCHPERSRRTPSVYSGLRLWDPSASLRFAQDDKGWSFFRHSCLVIPTNVEESCDFCRIQTLRPHPTIAKGKDFSTSVEMTQTEWQGINANKHLTIIKKWCRLTYGISYMLDTWQGHSKRRLVPLHFMST
jgi:hypothetical protein